MRKIPTFLQSQTNDANEVCEVEDDDDINGQKAKRRDTAPKRTNNKKINY